MSVPQPWDHPDADEMTQRLTTTDAEVHLEQAQRTAAQVARIFTAHYQALRRARLPRRLRAKLTETYAESVLCQLHNHADPDDETSVG